MILGRCFCGSGEEVDLLLLLFFLTAAILGIQFDQILQF